MSDDNENKYCRVCGSKMVQKHDEDNLVQYKCYSCGSEIRNGEFITGSKARRALYLGGSL